MLENDRAVLIGVFVEHNAGRGTRQQLFQLRLALAERSARSRHA
jgi:hypothetical protein